MSAMHILQVVLLLIAAYMLGSIPSAVWFGLWFRGVDVREHGSHNAGTTNTIRVLGLRLGLLVFAVDLLKGFAAVHLVALLPQDTPFSVMWVALQLGIAATLGHIFPLFASFRGGKGVATLCGVALAMHPMAALSSLLVFTLVVIITRYVSLGSLLAGFTFPLSLYLWGGISGNSVPVVVFGWAVVVLLVVTHRQNLSRLLHGEENKFCPSLRGNYDITTGDLADIEQQADEADDDSSC